MFPVKYEVKSGVNKNGKNYKFLIFKIHTPHGIFTSGPVFPTPLEMSIIDHVETAVENIKNSEPSGISEIYSDASLKAEF